MTHGSIFDVFMRDRKSEKRAVQLAMAFSGLTVCLGVGYTSMHSTRTTSAVMSLQGLVFMGVWAWSKLMGKIAHGICDHLMALRVKWICKS